MSQCPFCGESKTKVVSKNQVLRDEYGSPYKVKRYYVKCNCCHARGSLCGTKEFAEIAWINATMRTQSEVEYAFRYAMNASAGVDHEHFSDEVETEFDEFKRKSDYFEE